jgi:hypothetical protein
MNYQTWLIEIRPEIIIKKVKKPKKKICYKDGELGVLFLFVDGDEHKQTLHPAYSMYGIAI